MSHSYKFSGYLLISHTSSLYHSKESSMIKDSEVSSHSYIEKMKRLVIDLFETAKVFSWLFKYLTHSTFYGLFKNDVMMTNELVYSFF